MTLAFLLFTIVLGLMTGSFLSVLIPRLHFEEKGILLGRSACPHCKKTLKAKDLIPLLSYLSTNGKCRYCKRQISTWYPALEITSAVTFGILFVYSLDPVTWIWHSLLFTVLLFIFFYDLRFQEIHDLVMLPAIILAFFYSLIHQNIESGLIGAAIAVAFFGLQYLVSKGKWIGSGDLRIGAFMGLMLGFKLTIVALIVSYVVGSITGVILLISKKAKAKTKIALGPFLVIGTIIAFFYGEKLLEWYFNLLLI